MFFLVRRKNIHLLWILSLVLVVVTLSRVSLNPKSDSLNLIDQLTMSLWSNRIKSEITGSGSVFYKRITAMFQQKREEATKESVEDDFWLVDTVLTDVQTELQVPSYFSKPVDQRPKVVPFDPRFTLAVYYHHLASNPDAFKDPVPFHWSDWVDVSVLDKYLLAADQSHITCEMLDERPHQESLMKDEEPGKKPPLKQGAKDPNEYCRQETEHDGNGLGIVVDKFFGRMREDNCRVAGKMYIYSSAPNPSSIIFLTKDGSYTVEVATERTNLVKNNLVDNYLKDSNKDMVINTLKEFKNLKRKVPPSVKDVVSDYQIELKQEDFQFNDIQVLQELEKRQRSGSLKKVESAYLESLRYAVSVKRNPPKYFNEAKVFLNLYGDHYDFRFFNGFKIGSVEQANTLHRLSRVWLSFARKQGITTWMAHGSLLAWYWNGIAFPWDNDIDVQVPIMDLHKLSMRFNQSLIVEDGEDGFGRYFLDCGTFIATRDHSNGNNNIDARFIDVDSGLYIDITGLAVSNDEAPARYRQSLPATFDKTGLSNSDINKQLQVYNCRNRHFVNLHEVSPLVKSYVESEVAYIPQRFSDILAYEYKGNGVTNKFFESRFFMPQLRLWVHQDILRRFIRHRALWDDCYVKGNIDVTFPSEKQSLTAPEMKTLTSLSEDDLFALLQRTDLLIDYMRTRDLTSVHENEIMRFLFGKSTETVLDHAPELHPLMYESFLYHLNQDLNTFDARVERYIKLNEKYEADLKAQQEEKEKPQEEKEKPQEEREKPQEEREKPQEEKEKPQEEREKPQEEKEKPQEEKEKPQEEKEKPQEEKEKPQDQ